MDWYYEEIKELVKSINKYVEEENKREKTYEKEFRDGFYEIYNSFENSLNVLLRLARSKSPTREEYDALSNVLKKLEESVTTVQERIDQLLEELRYLLWGPVDWKESHYKVGGMIIALQYLMNESTSEVVESCGESIFLSFLIPSPQLRIWQEVRSLQEYWRERENMLEIDEKLQKYKKRFEELRVRLSQTVKDYRKIYFNKIIPSKTLHERLHENFLRKLLSP